MSSEAQLLQSIPICVIKLLGCCRTIIKKTLNPEYVLYTYFIFIYYTSVYFSGLLIYACTYCERFRTLIYSYITSTWHDIITLHNLTFFSWAIGRSSPLQPKFHKIQLLIQAKIWNGRESVSYPRNAKQLLIVLFTDKTYKCETSLYKA